MKPVVPPPSESNADVEKSAPAPAKKIVNLNEPQICRNKGCGKTFKEKDNHESACEYHPGPAVFHDRMRGVSLHNCLSGLQLSLFLISTCFKSHPILSFCSGNAVTFMSRSLMSLWTYPHALRVGTMQIRCLKCSFSMRISREFESLKSAVFGMGEGLVIQFLGELLLVFVFFASL